MKILKPLIIFSLIGLIPDSYADIFGQDDRIDIHRTSAVQKERRSVAVGVLSTLFEDLGHGYSNLWADPISDYMCKDEAFFDQSSVSYACTGFLVGKDLLVTAGHCGVNFGEIRNVTDMYCESYTWLFDYTSQSNIKSIPNNNIYKCKEIIYAVQTEVDGQSHDFALIRLDRAVVGREPLKLTKKAVRKGDSVTMLGHPMGLPMKYTTNAHVFDPNRGRSFYTNLDAFSGNSGSPVFNEEKQVVGILVAGNPGLSTYTDSDLRCDRYNRCDEEGKNCTSLPQHNDSEGFPHTYSEVQSIAHYLELIQGEL